jgi:hypothetical protein
MAIRCVLLLLFVIEMMERKRKTVLCLKEIETQKKNGQTRERECVYGNFVVILTPNTHRQQILVSGNNVREPLYLLRFLDAFIIICVSRNCHESFRFASGGFLDRFAQ